MIVEGWEAVVRGAIERVDDADNGDEENWKKFKVHW